MYKAIKYDSSTYKVTIYNPDDMELQVVPISSIAMFMRSGIEVHPFGVLDFPLPKEVIPFKDYNISLDIYQLRINNLEYTSIIKQVPLAVLMIDSGIKCRGYNNEYIA